jgi:RNA methyltransferase, TrmH family
MGGGQTPLSVRNPKVQHLRRLIARRSARIDARQFVFEGPTLLAEALDAAFALDAVFVDGDAVDRFASLWDRLAPSTEVHHLAKGVLARISDTTTPQGLIAVAPRPNRGLDALIASVPRGLVVVLDAVGDPGNAGAIVRTAEAVGATAVISCGSSADPYGPKTVRAAAGSVFRLPPLSAASTPEALSSLRGAGFSILGTVAAGGTSYREVDLSGDVAMVFGSEAHGLSATVVNLLDRRVTIPMRGGVESLNVAAVAAVLGYERVRQLDAARPPG